MSPSSSPQDDAVMAPMTSDYNNLNKSQSTVWKRTKPLFEKALESLLPPLAEGSCFRVADLGCATGGNSVAPLSFVSDQISAKSKSKSNVGVVNLEVFLGDLPNNAWNSVVTTVTPESITAGHGRSASDTFVYMVGRTFYESCAPPGSLNMSYSLVAVHWMKSYPGDIPTGLYATDPLHVTDPPLLQAWRDAGTRDFAEFTQARYRELKMGGRFIGAVACPKENGDYPWSNVGKLLYDALLSKVESPQDLAACVLPCCWRTEADVRAGFDSNIWEMEACEFHQTKDPVRESLERGEITPREYGKSVIESFKAVAHHTCVSALTKSMPPAKVEQLLNAAYQQTIDGIAADPEQYNLDVAMWYVMAKKKDI